MRQVVRLIPRRRTVEVYVDVPQGIAEFLQAQPYHMTAVLDPGGDSAATIVAAVGFPRPVDAVAP